MKNLFYINNTKTDQNFCIIENSFFDSNWNPSLSKDKEELELIIKYDSATFKDCEIITVSF